MNEQAHFIWQKGNSRTQLRNDTPAKGKSEKRDLAKNKTRRKTSMEHHT
jgi:hypothetical protein